MDDLETKCLEKLDFTPVAYYRYINDIFAIIPEDEIDHMLNVFNSYNNRLQFTHELGINQGLSFFDLHISKDNGKIITNWYQKPTSFGRFLNYKSEHLFNRIDRIDNLYSSTRTKSYVIHRHFIIHFNIFYT